MIQTATFFQSNHGSIKDMQLEFDHEKSSAVRTDSIPAAYAKLILPGHDPVIEVASPGVLLSQWLFEPDYNICVSHFVFTKPAILQVKIDEPCTSYYFAIENSVIILRKRLLISKKITIEEGAVAKLRFDKISRSHQVMFSPGTFISLHVTVPHQYMWKLQDEGWIYDKLQWYKSRIGSQRGI